ncbi:MAG: hypothetical protein LBC75_00130 [Fibromonadaceae bacterium]|nr:hypothetical protein [Fibromonadaceae bacterium]
MRSICLVIILFAFFASVKSYATEQIPDYLIYKGKSYLLDDVILYSYLDKANKWEWKGEGFCTALARGYYAGFEIVGNELILKDIGNCSKSLLKGFLSTFAAKDSIFKLSWFTDSIVISKGEPLDKRDGRYSLHKYYSVLHFEKGKLIKETSIDYKEYPNRGLKKQLKTISDNNLDTDGGLRKLLIYYNQRSLDLLEHGFEIEKGDKSEFLTKLKTKYEKIFGEPMSDFELRIKKITFFWNEDEFKNKDDLEINRTLYGALAEYHGKEPKENINVKLNIEEWLDFIRALYTCCLDKWERVPKRLDGDGGVGYGTSGMFYIFYGEDSRAYDEISIKSGKLPNVKEFEKIMEDIIAKMRKKPAEL